MSVPEPLTDRELLLQSLRQIRKLRSEIEIERSARSEPIAIVGIGCRFPGGANSPAQFWSLLRNGLHAVADMGDRRWVMSEVFDPDPRAAGKMYTRRAALLDRIDQFDAELFGISDREAEAMDPQQRLLLEVCWEAIEHAGYAPGALSGSATGVFVSLMNIEYATLAHEITPYLGAGNSLSVAAGRISYVLGFHGPCMALDTACSASALAVHLGCQSLRSRECDLALAGGANLLISPATSIAESKAMMLSRSGECRTFDASADGYVRGEGCGIVVLKRFFDAQAAGDTVHAIIRGSAVNHDGATQGLTAPSSAAQAKVMKAALKSADVDPRTVTYVEAHGTGTELGDPIECDALDRVYGAGRAPENRIRIGSVKTNVGHLESAAGVAGLIKAVLMLEHRTIVPHLNLSRINPHIRWQPCFEVSTKCIPWQSEAGPRRAGLSSFGFSGTNLHLVLEEAEVVSGGTSKAHPLRHLLVISARTAEGLSQLVRQYIDLLEECDSGRLADICFTAAIGRDHFQYRLAVVGADCDELRAKLQSALAQRHAPAVSRRRVPKFGLVIEAKSASPLPDPRSLSMSEPRFQAFLKDMEAAELPQALSHHLAVGALFKEWIAEPTLWIADDPARNVAIVEADGADLAVSLVEGRREARARSDKSDAIPNADRAGIFSYLRNAGVEAVILIGVDEGITLSNLSDEPQWSGRSNRAVGADGRDLYGQVLTVIAEAYQRGWPVRWDKMYADRNHRRVPIPLHPFERRRHWFQQEAVSPLSFGRGGADQSRLLQGQTGQFFLQKELSAPSIAEHRLFGAEVVPAAYYLAWVFDAVKRLSGAQTYRLRDVAFVAPLMLADRPSVLQLMIQRTTTRAAGTFSIVSQPRSDLDEQWTIHVTGGVDWGAKIAPSRAPTELGVIQSLWSPARHPDAYYAEVERRGLALGTPFRWLGAGFRHGNAVARLLVQPATRSQQAARWAGFDPGMLDACFHVLMSCLEDGGAPGEDQLWIPTGISELLIHGGVGDCRCFCHAQPTNVSADTASLDLQLCREDGSVAVAVCGLSLRPFSPRSVGSRDHASEGIARLLYRTAWRPVPLERDQTASQRRVLVLGQEDLLSHSVGETLKSIDFSVNTVLWQERYEHPAKGEHHLDPTDGEHFVRLFDALRAANDLPTDILWLCRSVDLADSVTLTDLMRLHRRTCLPLLHLARVISSIAFPSRCKLWVASEVPILARQANAAELVQAPARGMLKSLAIELYPGLTCARVDVQENDPARAAALIVGELAGNAAASDVAYRGGDRYESRLIPASDVVDAGPQLDGWATYLVTGASGGIGGALAHWLVERGARNLVLVSRGGAAGLSESLRAGVGAAGSILDFRLDVADEGAVRRLIGEVRERMPALKGVFHAAGVLDDGLLTDQSWQRFEKVMRPKISGAWNLHQATLDVPLDYFVLFSSVSSVFGAPGQTNYAAANAFLDALAEHRRSNGLAGCSINWGPWSDIGMASRLAAREQSWFGELGIAPLAPRTALRALDAIIASASTAVSVIDCDWTAAVSRLGPGLFSELGDGTRQKGTVEGRFGGVKARLAEADAEQRAELLLRECRTAVEEILKTNINDDDLHCTLVDLGLDSMAALRLRYGFHEELGVDIPLTHLLGELSLVALADRLGAAWRIGTEPVPDSRGRVAAALTEVAL